MSSMGGEDDPSLWDSSTVAPISEPLDDNPFASLLSHVPAAINNLPTTSSHHHHHPNSNLHLERLRKRSSVLTSHSDAYEVNEFIQKVFLFTVDEDHRDYSECSTNTYVHLTELAATLAVSGQTWLDFEHLQEAIFQRLLLEDPSAFLCPVSDTSNCHNNFWAL